MDRIHGFLNPFLAVRMDRVGCVGTGYAELRKAETMGIFEKMVVVRLSRALKSYSQNEEVMQRIGLQFVFRVQLILKNYVCHGMKPVLLLWLFF